MHVADACCWCFTPDCSSWQLWLQHSQSLWLCLKDCGATVSAPDHTTVPVVRPAGVGERRGPTQGLSSLCCVRIPGGSASCQCKGRLSELWQLGLQGYYLQLTLLWTAVGRQFKHDERLVLIVLTRLLTTLVHLYNLDGWLKVWNPLSLSRQLHKSKGAA